jgi:hypothetical protein
MSLGLGIGPLYRERRRAIVDADHTGQETSWLQKAAGVADPLLAPARATDLEFAYVDT